MFFWGLVEWLFADRRGGVGVESADSLIEPGCKLDFHQRLTPAYGIHPVPSLVEERREIVECAAGAFLMALQKSGGAACTEFALAGAHPHTCAAAQIDKIVHVQLLDGKIHFADRYLLAFAYEGILGVIVGCNASGQTPVALFGGFLLGAEFDDMGAAPAVVVGIVRAGQGTWAVSHLRSTPSLRQARSVASCAIRR